VFEPIAGLRTATVTDSDDSFVLEGAGVSMSEDACDAVWSPPTTTERSATVPANLLGELWLRVEARTHSQGWSQQSVRRVLGPALDKARSLRRQTCTFDAMSDRFADQG
jgi:hypothetical protein